MPRTARGFADAQQYIGEGMRIDFLPCHPDDKEVLLGELFDGVRQVGQEDVRVASTLLGIGFNTVHPFVDANGRMARTIYTGITRGLDAEEDLLDRRLGDTGDEQIELGNQFYRSGVYELMKRDQPEGFAPDDGVLFASKPVITAATFDGAVLKREFGRMVNRGETTRPEILTFMTNQDIQDLVVNSLHRLVSDGENDVDADRLLTSQYGRDFFFIDRFLTEGSDDDIAKAQESLRGITAGFVRKLISQFCLPYNEQMELMINTEEQGIMTMKFSDLGSLVAEGIITPKAIS